MFQTKAQEAKSKGKSATEEGSRKLISLSFSLASFRSLARSGSGRSGSSFCFNLASMSIKGNEIPKRLQWPILAKGKWGRKSKSCENEMVKELTHKRTHAHPHPHAHIHKHTRTRTHTHTHTHTQTHTHTHMTDAAERRSRKRRKGVELWKSLASCQKMNWGISSLLSYLFA